MKILILQDHLRSGGTERQSVFLANAFAAAGDSSTLLTFRPGGALAGTVATGVRHDSLQRRDLGLDWFAPGLGARVRAEDPDIVLAMGRMANCYAGRIQSVLRRAGSRAAVVATLRTGKPLPFLFRRSLQKVAAIVANSAEARDRAIAVQGIAPSRVAVIHNGLVFAPEATDGSRAEIRAAHGAGPATIVLLCVAMFRPEKNQRELIEIAATLPRDRDWQLWLAGDGPARGACEHLAATHGLADRIRFVGWQKNPVALYAAADLAVHASASESLSNFIIEAQAHGLPAVVYDALGMSECFLPGDTGLLVPRDNRAAFTAAILQFTSASPADSQARAARARAFARTTFDPARSVAAYRALFTRLTSKP